MKTTHPIAIRVLRSLVVGAFLACSGLAVGCASTASVQSVTVVRPPPASMKRLTIAVDPTMNNFRGEATALQNGLLREFQRKGYELGEGGLSVRAHIVEVDRGSTLANVTTGMGAGSDHVDVEVTVSDAGGNMLVAFLVRGSALDKRYSDLSEVLTEDVPKKVREQLEDASR